MRLPFLAAAMALLVAPFAASAAGASADMIKRGEYLTHAADCAACHTAPGGTPFAGGRAFKLPFGTLYAPNITPDKATGIGDYTDAEWLEMLQSGVARDGKHLYPAMPYQDYTKLTSDDALAIKAYLQSLPPVAARTPPNDLSFPFSQRWTMVFWNLLYNPNDRMASDPAKSADWNRGAYLVEALGHCAERHTPRRFTQGLNGSKSYAGADIDGWHAYNLSSDKTAGLGGWSNADLEEFLSTGKAKGHGPASGPMAEVISDSLRFLTPADIHAMVVYLRDVPAQPDGPPAPKAPPATASSATDALGARVFQQACAGCHLPNGQGRQSPWAALGGAHSLGDPSGQNIVQVLAKGTSMETAQGTVFMHNFTDGYTDAELAAVANYLIGQGGAQGTVTAEQIKAAKGQ